MISGRRWFRLRSCLLAATLVFSLPGLADLALAQAASGSTLGKAGRQPPAATLADRSELPGAFRKLAPASMNDLKEIQTHVQSLIARVSPAVVAVEIGGGTGSGVIVTPDGLVLTVAHLCGRVNRDVEIIFADGKNARGKVVGMDQENDAGLVRLNGAGPWPFVPVGELKSLEIGDWTIAMGHPGGYDSRRSVVVRLGRLIRLSGDNLQTDCTITLGDSGGPLFDMHGRVIGIHTSIRGSMAQNFHVPITDFFDGWEQLVAADLPPESVTARAYLGANGIQSAAGFRVTSVDPDGPAAKAGLKVRDIIRKIEGREIKTAASLHRWEAEAVPGETLILEIERDGATLSLKVRMQTPKTKAQG